MTEPQDGLSIGELAGAGTEVPAATLRSWEDRYAFPRPHRLRRRPPGATTKRISASSRRSCGCAPPG